MRALAYPSPTLKASPQMWLMGMSADRKKRATSVTEHQWAEQLRRYWAQAKARGEASQKDFAARYQLTQGMVSHYLTGETPLNVEAKLRFAQYLRISPAVIWPDFEFGDLVSRPDESLAMLDEADRQAVRSLIMSLQRRRA